MYSGSSDLTAIRAVKQELSIPVIANGDIRNEESAEAALDFTGCDGLMIGRAAMGNPFIFKRIRHYLETGERLEFDRQVRQLEDFENYITLLEEYDLHTSTNLRMHGRRRGRNKENPGYCRLEHRALRTSVKTEVLLFNFRF